MQNNKLLPIPYTNIQFQCSFMCVTVRPLKKTKSRLYGFYSMQYYPKEWKTSQLTFIHLDSPFLLVIMPLSLLFFGRLRASLNNQKCVSDFTCNKLLGVPVSVGQQRFSVVLVSNFIQFFVTEREYKPNFMPSLQYQITKYLDSI